MILSQVIQCLVLDDVVHGVGWPLLIRRKGIDMDGILLADLSSQLLSIHSLIPLESIIGILVVGVCTALLDGFNVAAVLPSLLMCFQVLYSHFCPSSLFSHIIESLLSIIFLPTLDCCMQIMYYLLFLSLRLKLLDVHAVHVDFGSFLLPQLVNASLAHFILRIQ